MSVVRVFGMRLGPGPRPHATREDVADLTTLPLRAKGEVPLDALLIAPPVAAWPKLEAPVPGLLVQGTLPDDAQARLVLRVPKEWNGRLVVSASPGVLGELCYDVYWSDFLLPRGYAFAAMDKGLHAVLDGSTLFVAQGPETKKRLWYPRFKNLAEFAAEECRAKRGRRPEAIYAVGVSNGGYLARRAAEEGAPFHAAIDVSGVFWNASPGNLLAQLAACLAATSGAEWDRGALARAGLPVDPDWDDVLRYYRQVYWDATFRLLCGDLDPEFSGPAEAYRWSERPPAVHAAAREIENTGDLKVPLVSLAGAFDFLIPPARHAEAYAELVRSRGKAALHELIVVPLATHVDRDADMFQRVTPIMPRAHQAFEDLARRVEGALASR